MVMTFPGAVSRTDLMATGGHGERRQLQIDDKARRAKREKGNPDGLNHLPA
jgi:hypothetical protein